MSASAEALISRVMAMAGLSGSIGAGAEDLRVPIPEYSDPLLRGFGGEGVLAPPAAMARAGHAGMARPIHFENGPCIVRPTSVCWSQKVMRKFQETTGEKDSQKSQ